MLYVDIVFLLRGRYLFRLKPCLSAFSVYSEFLRKWRISQKIENFFIFWFFLQILVLLVLKNQKTENFFRFQFYSFWKTKNTQNFSRFQFCSFFCSEFLQILVFPKRVKLKSEEILSFLVFQNEQNENPKKKPKNEEIIKKLRNSPFSEKFSENWECR